MKETETLLFNTLKGNTMKMMYGILFVDAMTPYWYHSKEEALRKAASMNLDCYVMSEDGYIIEHFYRQTNSCYEDF